MVLAAALITAFLVARFGDLPMPGAGNYTIYVLFTHAPGVTPGTPVRKSGVQIGRVTEVELLQPQGVRVTCEIDGGRTILDSEICRISTATVLGDAILEFVPGPATTAPGKPLEHNTEIQNGMVLGNPLDVFVNLEGDMRGALGSIRNAGDEVQIAARNINTALGNNDDQIPRLTQKAERALDEFTLAMTNINDIFGDAQMRNDLRQSLGDLPEMMQEMRGTMQNADRAFSSMQESSQRASRNLENLENFTRPLGERGPQLVENLDGSLANVNELMSQLVELTENMNSREGSLGRLLNDDELYVRLERTLINAEDITSRIKPILDDIRIFSDKIARDPRQLGLKGALDRRPVGTGTKNLLPEGHDHEMYVDPHGWEGPLLSPR